MKGIGNLRLQNPLPRAIRDKGEVQKFLRKYNVEPYFGSSAESSHGALNVFWDLYSMSPSYGTIVRDLCDYAFETLGEIERIAPFGMKLTRDEATDAERIAYGESLGLVGLSGSRIIEKTKQMLESYKVFGTVYLDYREVTIGSEKRVFFERLPTRDGILLTNPDAPDLPHEWQLLLIPELSDKQVLKGNFGILPIYPNIETESNGDRHTVFMLTNLMDDGSRYGRPDSMQSLMWQFVEYLIGVLQAKVASTEFVSKYVWLLQQVEFTADEQGKDPDDGGAKEAVANLRRITTNTGSYRDAEGFGVFDYPHGVDAPKLEKLDVNRDYAWLKTASDLSSSKIYASNRWPREFTGDVQTKSNIGGNILKDLLIMKQTGVIDSYQNLFRRFWRQPLTMVMEYAGREQMSEFDFIFTDRLEELIEKLTKNNPGGSSLTNDLQQEVTEGL